MLELQKTELPADKKVDDIKEWSEFIELSFSFRKYKLAVPNEIIGCQANLLQKLTF